MSRREPGYDTAWACSTAQHGTFGGVTTFAEQCGDMADGFQGAWLRFQNLILLAAKKPNFSGEAF